MIDVVNMHQFAHAMIGSRAAKRQNMTDAMRGGPKDRKRGPKKGKGGGKTLPDAHPMNFTSDWSTHPNNTDTHPYADVEYGRNRRAMSSAARRAVEFEKSVNQRLEEMRNQNR